MGSLQSPVERIEYTNWQPFPTKPTAMAKVVRIERALYGIGMSGAFYTTSSLAGRMHLLSHTVNPPSVIALLKLGVITEEQVAEHNKPCQEYQERMELYYAAQSDIKDLEKAGVKIDPKEKAKLRRRIKKLETTKLPYWARKKMAK